MKRNSPPKQKSAKLGTSVTPVATSRSHKPPPKSKGRIVRDKVIDGAISMSDGFLDYYQFIKELSEQFELGFTTQEMVSLTYEDTTSPWPETRKCSCMASKEQVAPNEKKYDNGSSQTPCPNCQASSKVVKETQSKKSPMSVTTPGSIIPSNCTVICPDCNRAQCNHPRRPGTSGGRKTSSPSSATKSVNLSRSTSLPKSKSRMPLASIACTCSMPSSQKTPSSASPGFQTRRSPEALKSSPTKIADGSELECSHLEFLPCKPDASLVGAISSVSVKGSVVCAPKLNYLSGLPPFGPQKEAICTTLNHSDSHASCCRVIRLSQHEHLLLRRFDKAKNWCAKLNNVLSVRGMRIFLRHQVWEIHVKGVLNFDHTRRKILMAIRSAVVWWDEQRNARCQRLLSRFSKVQSEVKEISASAEVRETGVETCEENQIPSDSNQGTDPPSNPDVICTFAPDSALLQQPGGNKEVSRSAGVQKAETAFAEIPLTAVSEDEAVNNNADAAVQPLRFKCAAFPDCQLMTAFPEQSCHRIFFDHEEHERLLHFEDTLQMTEKLNDVLKLQNLSIHLLKQKPELHIGGGRHIRGKLWRIVWAAAVDAGLHRALISLSRPMEVLETEDTPEPNTFVEVDENEPNHDSEEEDSLDSPSTVYIGERGFTCAEERGRSVVTLFRSRPMTPTPQASRLSCKNYPECTNVQDTGRPRCHVIPINSNDGSHANLLEWNRVDRFVRKLNEHLEDLKLQVSLLTSKPEFHVYGQSPETAVPMLLHVTTGLLSRENIKKNLLFLYPGYAKKIGRRWKTGSRGVCKCHGIVTTSRSQAKYRGAKYTIKAPFLREAQPY